MLIFPSALLQRVQPRSPLTHSSGSVSKPVFFSVSVQICPLFLAHFDKGSSGSDSKPRAFSFLNGYNTLLPKNLYSRVQCSKNFKKNLWKYLNILMNVYSMRTTHCAVAMKRFEQWGMCTVDFPKIALVFSIVDSWFDKRRTRSERSQWDLIWKFVYL